MSREIFSADAKRRPTAQEINDKRSNLSWRRMTKSLKRKFRSITGWWPSDPDGGGDRDITGELWMAFNTRCACHDDALDDDNYQLTIWRAAADVATRHTRVTTPKHDREKNAVQGYIFLKRYSELIPCSYASGKDGSLRVNRTDEQVLKWRHIVDTCKAIDMDPERTTFIARPVSAEFC